VKARVFINNRDTNLLHLNYNFNIYDIEDKDISAVDSAFTRKMNDSASTICLKIKVKENQFSVNDLVVDSLSFKDFVKGIIEKRGN
jgi:hypothetical protein